MRYAPPGMDAAPLAPPAPRPAARGARGRLWRKAGIASLWTLSAVLLVAIGPLLLVPGTPARTVNSWDLALYVVAGQLVAEGRGPELYDQQQNFQRRIALVGPEAGISSPRDLPYLSTPAQAATFAPFAGIPFPLFATLYRLHSILLFTWAMVLMRRWLPVPWPFATLVGLATPAGIQALAAGQNLHQTVFLWVLAARAVDAGRLNWAAGAFGVALLKPHVAILGYLLTAVRGGWIGAALSGAALYATSALVMRDPWWPRAWLAAASAGAADQPGGLTYTWLNGLVAAGVAGLWLLAPRAWRGRATLLLPLGVVALLPYANPYYGLLLVLPFWVAADAGLRGARWAWSRWRHRPPPVAAAASTAPASSTG